MGRKALVGMFNFGVAGFILTFMLITILKNAQAMNGIEVLIQMLWGFIAFSQLAMGIWVILEYRNDKSDAQQKS